MGLQGTVMKDLLHKGLWGSTLHHEGHWTFTLQSLLELLSKSIDIFCQYLLLRTLHLYMHIQCMYNSYTKWSLGNCRMYHVYVRFCIRFVFSYRQTCTHAHLTISTFLCVCLHFQHSVFTLSESQKETWPVNYFWKQKIHVSSSEPFKMRFRFQTFSLIPSLSKNDVIFQCKLIQTDFISSHFGA